jgi:enoyl-CoA hydratase
MNTTFDHLLVSKSDGVMTVRLNRPEVRNAMNRKLSQEVLGAIRLIGTDPDVRVGVFTGEGRSFCSGGDLSEHPGFVGDNFERETRVHEQTIFALLNCARPIIAKVNGDAVGWGATFSLFCDMIFADVNARFVVPQVKLGLTPGDGGSIIWPTLIGLPRAKQYLMTSRPLHAPKAAEIGLINEALPKAELDAAVDEIGAELAAMPPQALRLTKASMNGPTKMLVQSQMDISVAHQVATQKSEDHHEALRQFTEKSRPASRA